MAMKLDPTLGAEIPLDGWTNSVRSMKNESLLPPAFAGYSSIGLVGLHLRFLSAGVSVHALIYRRIIYRGWRDLWVFFSKKGRIDAGSSTRFYHPVEMFKRPGSSRSFSFVFR